MSNAAPRSTMETEMSDWLGLPLALADMTTEQCSLLLSAPNPTVILPVGSTEPHGPHLPLGTDTFLSEEHARRAASTLRGLGIATVVAPTVPYGVTHYAAGFAGTITVSAEVLESLLRELCTAYRAGGFAAVCVVNHHLEPEHVASIARAVERLHASPGRVVFANHLSQRWGRMLSAEFKRGNCHAGSYETSMMMASRPALVDHDKRTSLPAIDTSLSDAIREGKKTFREIGLDRAYTGSPAEATRSEGDDLLSRLVGMVLAEVREALGLVPNEVLKK